MLDGKEHPSPLKEKFYFSEREKKIQHVVTLMHYEPAVAGGIYDHGLSLLQGFFSSGRNDPCGRPQKMFHRPLAPSSGRVLPGLVNAFFLEFQENGRLWWKSSRQSSSSREAWQRADLASPGALCLPTLCRGRDISSQTPRDRAATGFPGIFKRSHFQTNL